MAVPALYISPYDSVKVPEGYYLRHIETGFQKYTKPYRGVHLFMQDGRPVAMLHYTQDFEFTGCIHAALFPAPMSQKPQRMEDRDLERLLIKVCAYDRITGGQHAARKT